MKNLNSNFSFGQGNQVETKHKTAGAENSSEAFFGFEVYTGQIDDRLQKQTQARQERANQIARLMQNDLVKQTPFQANTMPALREEEMQGLGLFAASHSVTNERIKETISTKGNRDFHANFNTPATYFEQADYSDNGNASASRQNKHSAGKNRHDLKKDFKDQKWMHKQERLIRQIISHADEAENYDGASGTGQAIVKRNPGPGLQARLPTKLPQITDGLNELFDDHSKLTKAGFESLDALTAVEKTWLNKMYKHWRSRDTLTDRLVTFANDGYLGHIAKTMHSKAAVQDFMRNWQSHQETLRQYGASLTLPPMVHMYNGRGMPTRDDLEYIERFCQVDDEFDLQLLRRISYAYHGCGVPPEAELNTFKAAFLAAREIELRAPDPDTLSREQTQYLKDACNNGGEFDEKLLRRLWYAFNTRGMPTGANVDHYKEAPISVPVSTVDNQINQGAA